MRLIGKILLVISLILSFLILLISISAKYQLLDSNFWINSFKEANVYSKIDDVLISETEKTFIKEGAGIKEAKQIATFFESANLQTFTEKNIVNVIDYVNAKTEDLTFYFPIEKLPAEIRGDLGLTSDQISINKLISTFGQNSTPAGVELFLQLRTLGNYLAISLVIAVVSVLVHLFLLYKMETPGTKLKLLGISFILSGLLTLLLVLLINIQITNVAQDLTSLPNREPSQLILGTLAPPLVKKITGLWIVLAIITVAIGIGFFFIKKRGVNIPKVAGKNTTIST